MQIQFSNIAIFPIVCVIHLSAVHMNLQLRKCIANPTLILKVLLKETFFKKWSFPIEKGLVKFYETIFLVVLYPS